MKMSFEIESVKDAEELQKVFSLLASKTAEFAEATVPGLSEKATKEHVEEVDEDEATSDAPDLTLTDVKRVVKKFDGGTKHPAVKNVMKSKFKIKALSALAEDDFAKFIAELETCLEEDDEPAETPAKATKKADEDNEDGYTLDGLRTLLRPIIRAKKNKKVKDILQVNYSVDSITDLDSDDYAAFAEDIKELIEELDL
ncbi:hypothetical protein [Listeria booriae]|uniref:hypothetical protein n=1 Tax=Listeria booriae TaxID=1552123 RepID=UPI00162A771B|nr:hypothetical protein [Listeria booriae]MBC2207439.1 hypothetical protein [Listeria booriae]